MNPGILRLLSVVVAFFLSVSLINGQDTRTRRAETPDPQNLDIIRVESNLVSVLVIVSDREGRYVPNLTVESFKLFDHTTEQKITLLRKRSH